MEYVDCSNEDKQLSALVQKQKSNSNPSELSYSRRLTGGQLSPSASAFLSPPPISEAERQYNSASRSEQS